MRKCTVIAQCLVNSDMIKPLKEAERVVRNIFHEEFPDQDFDKWNENLNDTAAENIVKAVGRASRINVKKFIEDLWRPRS